MKFRTSYDGKQSEVSQKVALRMKSDKPDRAKQAFKGDCDINLILKKYQATGVLPDQSKAALAQYGDFSAVPSYQDALNRVMDASNMFSQMPATLRRRFDNDPGQLLTFLADSNNLDEAIELGLVNKPTPQEPVPAPREPQAATSTQSKGKTATPKANVQEDD